MRISKADKVELKKLGAKLKSYRLRKGMTLKELGHEIDKEPQSISRVEMGDVNPTYLYLCKVCKGLDITILELLNEENP